MIYEATPGMRSGIVTIPSSKSQMHRLLIASALCKTETNISFLGLSADIRATMDCLNALGAKIDISSENTLHVVPLNDRPAGLCHLYCGESGSTLRFMIPVCGALGADVCFHMEGRLPQRPLAPYDELLMQHGMHINRRDDLLFCSGKLSSGSYSIPGDISSQYISGLLFSLPLLDGDSHLEITGKIESEAYITMTEKVLTAAGFELGKQDRRNYHIPGNQCGGSPSACSAEGDFSNAAFFLCIGALSEKGILVKGLSDDSAQGDIAIINILRGFGAEISHHSDGIFIKKNSLKGMVIDAAGVPDLIPVVSVVAAVAEGETRIINAGRLRLKESDRLKTTSALLTELGADVLELEDGLIIHGIKKYHGGIIDSANDHRIAMAAAVASTASSGKVTINGSECVKKSYPGFWKDFDTLEVQSV